MIENAFKFFFFKYRICLFKDEFISANIAFFRVQKVTRIMPVNGNPIGFNVQGVHKRKSQL